MIRFTLVSLAALGLAPLASAQAAYSAPKNAMGQPDLGGLWTNATVTQLERDPRFGDRLTMTQEEAGKLSPSDDAPVMQINGEYRTSFLTSPASGQLPPLTAQAKAARQRDREAREARKEQAAQDAAATGTPDPPPTDATGSDSGG